MFFLRRSLEKAVPDAEVHVFGYAEDALRYLRSPNRPHVDLLLIDISMPRMTGFEFADAYLELYPELRGNAPVYILSSSLDPTDQARALEHPAVSGYLEKPLTQDKIREILGSD